MKASLEEVFSISVKQLAKSHSRKEMIRLLDMALDETHEAGVTDWKYEVQNDDTVLGFEEWCQHRRESAKDSTITNG